jgi:hypothetical protein
MAASVNYNGAADAFQITFSTGYRVRFFIINILLLVLALLVLIATLIVAIRGGGLFGTRWFWLPAALGMSALVLRRILIAGLTAPPIIVDRSGNVRHGFQRVQFGDRPGVILTGPAAEFDEPIGFHRRGVRLNSSIILVGPHGARFVIYTSKDVHTVRHIFGGIRGWLGATNRRVVPQTSVPVGRLLLFGLVAVGSVSIVGLLVLVSDYLLFYPADIGAWALGDFGQQSANGIDRYNWRDVLDVAQQLCRRSGHDSVVRGFRLDLPDSRGEGADGASADEGRRGRTASRVECLEEL